MVQLHEYCIQCVRPETCHSGTTREIRCGGWCAYTRLSFSDALATSSVLVHLTAISSRTSPFCARRSLASCLPLEVIWHDQVTQIEAMGLYALCLLGRGLRFTVRERSTSRLSHRRVYHDSRNTTLTDFIFIILPHFH